MEADSTTGPDGDSLKDPFSHSSSHGHHHHSTINTSGPGLSSYEVDDHEDEVGDVEGAEEHWNSEYYVY